MITPITQQSSSLGQSGLFLPTDFPGTLLWLDGNDINGDGSAAVNGATLSTWTDKSGKSHSPTQATILFQPTSVTGYQNGRSAVFFAPSGTVTWMDSPNFDFGNSFTAYCSYRAENTQNSSIWDTKGTSLKESYFDSMSNTLKCALFNGADRGSVTGTANVNTPYIACYKYDSTANAQLWLNNVSQGSTTTSSITSVGSFSRRVGCHPTVLTAFFIGKIMELIIRTGVDTEYQRAQIQNYLNTKWAVY